MIDETAYKIALGGLIHDIGKLIQRSEDHPFDKTHGQWGYEWLTTNKFFDNNFVINSTITHHSKDKEVFLSNFGLIWYEADNLASFERKQEDHTEQGRWEMFTPLASPFSHVRNPNNPAEALIEIPYLQLEQKKNVEVVSFKEPEITVESYRAIRRKLEKDLKSADKPYSINLLLMLFEKHLSNVPSITREIIKGQQEEGHRHPDISLFNHLKLTASIATCMYYFLKETYPEKWNNNELLKDEILNPSPEVKPYLLIGGDISGVQKFIYTITSKGALKSLKGRSFYLELLTEHIISELLDTLKLTRCNLIFSGGGHFYILSYNTPSAQTEIDNVKKKIDDFLFEEFKGNLQIHLAGVPFSKEGFKNSVDVWQELSNKLQQLKKRKWKGKIYEVLKVEAQHQDCLTTSCEVCFREDLRLEELKRDDDIIKVCKPCYHQYLLGSELSKISKATYPVIYKLPQSTESNYIKIGDWYYQVEFGFDKDLHQNAKAEYRLNDQNVTHYSHPNSIYLPVGIYQHESIKELSDAVDHYGINRIAVLRMDVDNLGKIFSHAVPEKYRTFSRMASISKGLNQFFKYFLNNIVEGKVIEDPWNILDRDIKETGRKVSIVYSGGDDLFIIGHWLDVIETAYDIRRYFELYTGNRFMTVSAGIVINHEKYPVYQFAKDAEEAEKNAKKGGKNAIAIFSDKSLNWKTFEKVIERIKLFKKFLKQEENHLNVDEDKLPKTFYYRLYSLAKKFNEEGVLILPKAAYLISRAKLKEINDEDKLKLKEVIMNTNKEEWLITETAVLIILMLMRKGGKKDALSKTAT